MGPAESLRLEIARGLEEGAWSGPVASVVSRAWTGAWGVLGARSLTRPLTWREGLCTVAVGGATLGGSGKTPLAIACAALMAEEARVAFVAHGYRARPGSARVVRVDDDVAVVGDEALVAARALRGKASVVVAPSRQAALDLASTRADVVVIDGVLQTTPVRPSLSLLALDPIAPWGAGHLPPRGDLRAPPSSLLAACDCAVPLQYRSRGAYVSGHLVPWYDLIPLRIGLFLALARPARVTALLASHGVLPRRILRLPDHGAPREAFSAAFLDPQAPRVDLWLATPKCATHLEAAGLPHAVLEHTVQLEDSLKGALRLAYTRPPPRFALLDPP